MAVKKKVKRNVSKQKTAKKTHAPRKPVNLVPILMGVFVLFLILAVGAVLLFLPVQRTVTYHPTNYEECVAAGNITLKTYPGKCITKDGQEFLQVIPGIDSFESCAAAGYPILESYPEQCLTPDGRTFVKVYAGV